MDIISEIGNWSKGFLEDPLFLVGVEQKVGSKKISVFIDGDEGVNIEACRKLSRHLSEKLDALDYGDTAYYLEVSSPGVDRPLVEPRQYKKHIGRELMVKLVSQTELLGKLDTVTETGITLLLKDKKKLYKDATAKDIPFAEMESAMVQISFN
jgi:ribosome maturation factor RimP